MNYSMSIIDKKRFTQINLKLISGEIINYHEIINDNDILRSTDKDDTDFSFIIKNEDLFKSAAETVNRSLVCVDDKFYYYINNDEKDIKKEALLRLKSELSLMLIFLSSFASETGRGCDFTDPNSITGINKDRFFEHCESNYLIKNAFNRIKDSNINKVYSKLKKQGFLFEKSGMIFFTEISNYIFKKDMEDYYKYKN